MAYTVTDFLALVRQYGMLPSTTSNGTADADILTVADEELRTRMAPLIVSSNTETWVTRQRVPLTASQAVYRIPKRAVGGRLREIGLKRADGSFKNLRRIEIEHSYNLSADTAGEPEVFLVRGENVWLFPKPVATSGWLQMEFYARPGRLTATSPSGYAILTRNDTTRELGTTSPPITVGTAGYCDIVRASSGYGAIAVDVLGAQTQPFLSSFAVTNDYEYPDEIATVVGDYLFPADSCFVIPLPVELHGVFVHYVVASLKRQLNDQSSAAIFEGTAEKLAQAALQTLCPRVDGEPRKVRGGILWQSKKSWWSRGF